MGKVFLPALFYKVLMGWLLGVVFFYYYQQGDTINYFNDARQLTLIAYKEPINYLKVLTGQLPSPVSLTFLQQPRALFFTKIVSIIGVFTYNNYWITSAYLSLLSFIGSWKLANYLSQRFSQHRFAAAVAFLFYPSVAFWGSGVLKESIAVATITLIVYIVLRLQSSEIQGRKIVFTLLMLAFSVLVLWKIKYYYAGVLFPMLFAAVLVCYVSRGKRWSVMLITFAGSWLLFVGIASLLHPVLSLDYLPNVLQYNHDRIVQLSDSSNVIHFSNLNGQLSSFVKNLPLAVVSGLFRPLAGEGDTFFQWSAGIENTVLLLIVIGALIKGWRIKASNIDRLWVVAALTYIIILGGLLAFASPNFGSLVRYKVAFSPFLVFLALAGNQRLIEKVRRKFNF